MLRQNWARISTLVSSVRRSILRRRWAAGQANPLNTFAAPPRTFLGGTDDRSTATAPSPANSARAPPPDLDADHAARHLRPIPTLGEHCAVVLFLLRQESGPMVYPCSWSTSRLVIRRRAAVFHRGGHLATQHSPAQVLPALALAQRPLTNLFPPKLEAQRRVSTRTVEHRRADPPPPMLAPPRASPSAV